MTQDVSPGEYVDADAPRGLVPADDTGPARASRKLHLAFLGALLLVAAAIRLIDVNAPPRGPLIWRETQTLMMARNYGEKSLNLFRPEVDFRPTDRPVESGAVGGTELPVVSWLTGILYRVAGIAYWAGRVFPILFSLLGLALFHRLAARWHGERCASIATLLLTVSPLYWYLGRTHMPESFAFAMAFGMLYWFDRWAETRTKRDFCFAAIACALALMGKIHMGVLALPMAFVALRRFGWRTAITPALYGFAAAVGLPVLVFMWYSYYVLIAETGLSFAQPELMRYAMAWDWEYHRIIWSSVFTEAVGPVASVAALAGLFLFPTRRRTGWALYFWVFAGVAFFFLMPGGNKVNPYYQMMVTPPACILAARVIRALFARRWSFVFGLALAVAICAQSAQITRGFFASDAGRVLHECGAWLHDNTPEDTRVLTLTPNTASLYFADRTGWICWRQNYGEPIPVNMALLDNTRKLGATVVAVPGIAPYENAFDRAAGQWAPVGEYLFENAGAVLMPEWSVFLLDRPANLSLPKSGIRFGMRESRKYLRGTWGPNQKRPDNQTFVVLGPEKSGAIRFEHPERPCRLRLDVATPVAGQKLHVVLDGREVAHPTLDTLWEIRPVSLGRLPAPPSGTRHTIEISVDKQADGDKGLLLYGLTAEQVLQ